MLSSVLVLVGVFCIVLAGLLAFYAPGKALKTPLNLNIKQIATGPAKILNSSTGQVEDTQLIATRRVRTDSSASDSSVTVIQETLCIVKNVGNPPECVDKDDPQARLVSFTTDRVAADRKSAESVNDSKYGENINGAGAKHIGLTYKFPFNAKKQTYKFFDPQSQQSPDAKYLGTDKLLGMSLYKYEAVISNVSLDVGPGIPGTYSDTRTVWVDPKTGTIVKGIEHQVRTLTSGLTALDTTLTFDAASQKYQADFAKNGKRKILLLTVILPIVAFVLGLLALVFGLLLAFRSRPESGRPVQTGEPDRSPEPVGRH
ncbi:DUF3068 domain-containing protein [Jatrophihabitans telluris]|uniref:DUF3068 domain-containing protein n=1 Tax=Jatrophihabitans telluris TaxID=2038343 RepID=A0ABY4QVR0_9ACTN|nr:DUF3068 domain-containing protein [Jatrophihabitans telluris]UQX87126.1 DUF3068 domain-containing protein [Jatrophihabitans telluris]